MLNFLNRLTTKGDYSIIKRDLFSFIGGEGVKVIGLCGGSGSGKGQASLCFAKRGVPSLDTDSLYHSIISRDSECTREIASVFGSGILDSNCGVDRKKLSSIVFSDESGEKLQLLNTITHKFVLDGCRKWLDVQRRNGCRAAIIDAPLLFESGFDRECDVIICVEADEKTRIKRIIDRDNTTEEMAKSRINSQADDDFLKKHSDYIIENSADVSALDLQVEKICRLILE